MQQHPVIQWARAFARLESYASAKFNVSASLLRATYHGHDIAFRRLDGTVCLTGAGWLHSPCTRERLNQLCAALGIHDRFSQRKHEYYFGARKIDAEEVIELPCGYPSGEDA